MHDTKWEDMLCRQIELHGLPKPERESKIIPKRQFRYDLCWPEHKLVVEVQGSTWVAGRGHSSGVGIKRDAEKLNLAVLEGYYEMQFVADHIKSGKAIYWLQQFFNNSKGE